MADGHYECKSIAETGMMIGLAAGIAAFVALAYLGYATGQTWLALVGFPLILVGILAAQRQSIYDLKPDGLLVRNRPARAWAFLSAPGERLVRFDEMKSVGIRFGQGSTANNLVIRTKDGVRIPVTQDRLERALPDWGNFVRAFSIAALPSGLVVVGADRL